LSQKKEIFLLLISDFIAINLTWIIYFFIRVESGWFAYTKVPSFVFPMLAVYFFWLLMFSFFGLYQHWYIRSRIDEINSIIKTTLVGIFILFFLIFIDDALSNIKFISRALIVLYWGLLVLITAVGRLVIRNMQIKLLRNGIGLKNTIVVGTNKKAYEIEEMINLYPEYGFKLIGYIESDNEMEKDNNFHVLGELNDIKKIIEEYNIEEVFIATEPSKRDIIMSVVNKTSDTNVRLKIMPDSHEVISGMVKTQHIYGTPLIDVMPELITLRLKIIKRFIDIFISVFVLTSLFPFMTLIAIIIKLTSKGPLIYIQKRIGKNGKIFKIYKFRSMYLNAESKGPVWARQNDPRVTPIGKFMRRTRIDELPQFWNVLKNDMSIVGPRPERPYFVEILKKEIPYYSRRFKVKPGITGWAQIKLEYDSSIDDVKAKLKYDFYYIENMSITLDIKIIVHTLSVIFKMKGH